VQVGVTRIIEPIFADYETPKGERIRRGLTCLTFPFNFCTNVAMLCMVATHTATVVQKTAEDARQDAI
jgi:hypothetical protein